MTDWRIRGHPNEGGFPTQGHAIAHAWSITAAGGQRPQVYLHVSSEPGPLVQELQTRTYDAERIGARMMIADVAFREVNEAMYKADLIRQMENACVQRDMKFDPDQIEFSIERNPATFEIIIRASAMAWPAEAVQHGFPPKGERQITVALPSEWRPLGHMSNDGITYY